MSAGSENFGPFANVPSADIHPAGFACRVCRRPVRVLRRHIPLLVARMCFFQCGCGPTTVVWEDENQPNARVWPKNIRLARRTGAEVLIFNGDRELSPGFGGMN